MNPNPDLTTAAARLALAARPGAASDTAWAELISHRAYLVRFARRRLRDPVLAEDAVHDVFEAVLSGRATFAGRAALRSWLTAVLKHKIVDTVRRQARYAPIDDAVDEQGGPAIECPQPGPGDIAEQRERLAQTLARIETLPRGLRDAVRLRLIDEQPTATVCATLGISADNLFVRMHRARKQLLS